MTNDPAQYRTALKQLALKLKGKPIKPFIGGYNIATDRVVGNWKFGNLKVELSYGRYGINGIPYLIGITTSKPEYNQCTTSVEGAATILTWIVENEEKEKSTTIHGTSETS